ncbi:uroporphyrinogen-III synthase [Pseudomaricurvus sp. HS19]|uniref:uroporphyrinogen-III synthase n=1 Tax=Pseudomaricurvus sp. HS19 TaxID=2692626 RepID=UPI00136C5A12|nr:uroporphyrinogen-III synthase [Pseudomaricurvus sp. HS19]MYM63867.1 uroporphyrinogen-III synthase [Pseudomaricurvus sp. HS19]
MVNAHSEIDGQQPLRGLRVLLTRPQQQLPKWQSLLQSGGAETCRVPLMAIEPLSEPAATQAIRDRIMALAEYRHVIFVSQNAAHHGLDWIDQYWPQLPVGVHFYAVGAATARVLQAYGCSVTAADNTMNSEELLALPQLQQVELQKVLICRGRGGRPLLAQVLSERGAQVDYCELYERGFPVEEALTNLLQAQCGRNGDLVALHSGEALDNWHQLLQALKQEQPQLAATCAVLPLLVPGGRVGQLARDRGYPEVIVARNASDEEMLAALRDWRLSRNP